MEDINVRQEVFSFIDKKKSFFMDKSISRVKKNERLYNEFENVSKAILRVYKQQYYDELKKEESLDIALGLNSDNEIKVSKNSRKDNDKAFQIFPLIKTFKLLPLYLFKLTYTHAKRITSNKDFLISNIFCNLIDSMNKGHYKINEVSDFMTDIDHNLKGFLDHDSWKRDLIVQTTAWIKELFFKIEESNNHSILGNHKKTNDIKNKRVDFVEAYHYLRGKILTYLLPNIYGVYFYERKKKYIIRDFAKACYVMNFCKSEMVSLTDLIDKYNEDLEYRERPKKYYIDLGFNEKLEFLNPELYKQQQEIYNRPEYQNILKKKGYSS